MSRQAQRAMLIAYSLGMGVPSLTKQQTEPPDDQQPVKKGRNGPCPCGSGKKYKKCCLVTERAQARAAQAKRRYALRTRTPPKPISASSIEESVDTVAVLDPQFDGEATITTMRNAGVKAEVIYAFQQTGRFISPESREVYDEHTLAEWDKAIEEYRTDGEKDCVPDEVDSSAGEGANARE